MFDIEAFPKTKQYLNFAEYLEIALYHPTYGYYMKKDSPFGRDFVTAPMLSDCLAEAISKWLLDQGVDTVLEIGAGMGYLSDQLLKRCHFLTEYAIWEKNPKASKWLQDSRCRWVEAVSDFKGAVIANEVLDALPFRRFCWHQGLSEFMVDTKTMTMVLQKTEVVLPSSIMAVLSTYKDPYVFEYCDYRPFFSTLSQVSGPLLFIDYGYEDDYFHPDRALGNMMCFSKQKTVPFSLGQTGMIDISAAVNFSAVKEAASQYGFTLDNIGPQVDFILHYVSHLSTQDWVLVSEHEMGSYVKVASFSRN